MLLLVPGILIFECCNRGQRIEKQHPSLGHFSVSLSMAALVQSSNIHVTLIHDKQAATREEPSSTSNSEWTNNDEKHLNCSNAQWCASWGPLGGLLGAKWGQVTKVGQDEQPRWQKTPLKQPSQNGCHARILEPRGQFSL